MKKEKKSLKEKCWAFFDAHPKVTIFMDLLDVISNRFVLVYTAFFAVILIGIPVIAIYSALPAEIRGELSAILGTLLSVVVMPLVLNNYNRKKDGIAKRFEKNSSLYIKLSELLVTILTHKEDTVNNTLKVQQYIRDNYPQMCLSFPTSLISNLYSVYRNCKNGNYANVRYFGEKCLMAIRREGGVGKEFQFSSLILEAMQDNILPAKDIISEESKVN